MVHTALTSLLMEAGLPLYRAEAVDRHMDQHMPSGLTGDSLAALIIVLRPLPVRKSFKLRASQVARQLTLPGLAPLGGSRYSGV